MLFAPLSKSFLTNPSVSCPLFPAKITLAKVSWDSLGHTKSHTFSFTSPWSLIFLAQRSPSSFPDLSFPIHPTYLSWFLAEGGWWELAAGKQQLPADAQHREGRKFCSKWCRWSLTPLCSLGPAIQWTNPFLSPEQVFLWLPQTQGWSTTHYLTRH